DFGGGPVDVGGGGLFLTGYDPSGNYLGWLKTSGMSGDYGGAVKIDSSGNLAFTGKTKGGTYFGPGTDSLYATGQDNYFVSGFTISGNSAPVWKWSEVSGSANGSQPASTAVSYGKALAFDPL